MRGQKFVPDSADFVVMSWMLLGALVLRWSLVRAEFGRLMGELAAIKGDFV